MAAPTKLSSPPITEALLDIRISRSEGITRDSLARLKEKIGDRYPHSEERIAGKAEFRVQDGKIVATSSDPSFDGLWFHNEGRTRIAQFTSGGFTLNQLPPYESGRWLVDEGLELWGHFCALAGVQQVERLAVRYINQLRLPWREGDPFERFLTAAPELPDGCPEMIGSFVSRVVARERNTEIDAIVTQKLEPTLEGGGLVVLDIDVYTDESLPAASEQIRAVFERLLELKNRIFFALVTDEALEMYR